MKSFSMSVFHQASRLLAVLVIVCSTAALSAQTPVRVYNTIHTDRTDCPGLNKLIQILPYCETNEYQTIANHHFGTNGEKKTTDEKHHYLWQKTTNFYYAPDVITFSDTFDFIPTHFVMNLDSITMLYPYDSTSEEWLWHTGTEGVYVCPDNAVIDSLADMIWDQSSDIIDFARQCYEYVAGHLTYQNPGTGLHSIEDILAWGGGDCGNFASVYISMLRNKGVPARHVVGFSPYNDNDMHVWAEFFLQGYGWFPADPTYKNSDPSGDYFGRYSYNYCIAGKDINHVYNLGGAQNQAEPLLQTYLWWYWYNGTCHYIDTYREISCDALYHIVGVADNDSSGSVTGSGYYVQGEEARLEAVPSTGYTFRHWSNGSTENPLIVNVGASDENFTAYFSEVEDVNIESVLDVSFGVRAEGNTIFVVNPQGSRIIICNVQGQPLSVSRQTSQDVTVPVAGVYLVSGGHGHCQKVVIF